MPRQTVRRRTQTDVTPSARRTAPRLEVVAPLNVQAPYRGAEALLSALGIAGQFAAARHEQNELDNAALGAADAARGTVDPKKVAKSRAYEDAVISTQAEAKFINAETRFRDWYQKEFDKANGLPSELNAKIEEFYREEFADAGNDPRVARALVARMAKFREEMVKTQEAEVRAAVEQEQIAAVGAILRDRLLKGEAVDVEDIMARLRPVVGNSRAAQAYVDLVGNIAVEAGAPGILDALIPEKWKDGTPGPRSVPALNKDINQYRYFAQGAENARLEQQKEAAKIGRDSAMRELTLLALRTNPTARAADLLQNGVINDDDFQQIINRYRTNRDDARDQSIDLVEYNALRRRLAEDPSKVPSEEVADFVLSLPPGDKSINLANGLWDDFEQAMRSERIEGARLTPKAQAYLDALKTKYQTTDEEDRIGYADMLLDFRRKVLDGMDPQQAFEEAEAFMKSTDTTANVRGDAVEDANSFAIGAISAAQYVSRHNSEASVQALITAYRAGKTKLTPEQYAALLRAIKATP